MAPCPLGRLHRVNLRNYWQSEAADFTPWLAQDYNLALLGEALGLDLLLESTEAAVGPYSADIVCRSASDSSVVLIENQLEKTDHTHLGQLFTYAAGINAVTLVWIAARFTDEHRAALDWLNSITPETLNAFGLEIELWQIDDSPPAPKFNIVAQPNNWTKIVRKVTAESGEFTEAQKNWMSYWASFAAFLEEKGKPFRPPKPQASHWVAWSLGRRASIQTTVGFRDSLVTSFVALDGPDAKAMFRLLREDQDVINSQLPFEVEWQERPDIQSSHVKSWAEFNLKDQSSWPRAHEWMLEHLTAFDRIFRQRIQDLDLTGNALLEEPYP